MKTCLSYILLAFAAMIFPTPDLGAQDTARRNKQVQQQHKRTQESEKTRQARQYQKFVDLDGDGYNDNAPDHDGDGIPNRFDPDWKRRKRAKRSQFIDLNGDGINDNLQQKERNGREQMAPGAGEEDGASMKNQEQRQIRKGRKGSGKSGS